MLRFDPEAGLLVGPSGSIPVPADDEVVRKLVMLLNGECLGQGPLAAAEAAGYCKQRYYQLRDSFSGQGSASLRDKKPGPKRRSRRTDEVVRQVIRHRFLDPEASPEVIAQKLLQAGLKVSTRSVERVIAHFGLQKKLHRCKPGTEPPPRAVSGRAHERPVACDPASLERGVRQALADKVSGSHLGLWLLAAEHLRLGTRGLLLAWTGRPACGVEPRLALQLANEAAMCVAGLRVKRSPPQAAFGLVNGLPFLASDTAVHQLLAARTLEEGRGPQRAPGLRRAAGGDFAGGVLIVDPHRVLSQSKRRMRRHRKEPSAKPAKVAQTFFAVDGDTRQPVCFTTGTASRTVTRATPELLDLAAAVLPAREGKTLVLADAEHFSAALMRQVKEGGRFDLMTPMILQPKTLAGPRALPEDAFKRRWAGYATRRCAYSPCGRKGEGEHMLLVQRFGEREGEYKFNAFVCTGGRDELEALTDEYPKRWHAEEFFNEEQGLGWDRAGTQDLNIRYGQMTMALVAQAALHRVRRRLGGPVAGWDARHLARDLPSGLEGDVRVTGDTVMVTYYNAPDAARLRGHYENLPAKLRAEGIDPAVPWLYGYKLDFRFR